MNKFTRFSASPEDTYVPYKIRRRRNDDPNAWCAPEHRKHAKHMERDYPLDVNGRRMFDQGRRLVLDPRPEILQPKRTPIFLGLDEGSA